MKNFLGVIGGMGPLATADYLRKLVLKTPAAVDQEHIPVLLYGDCTTPDRTEGILGKGPSPLPHLLEGIRLLNEQGAKAICIPCNSAHAWFDELQAASQVPLLHIVRASAEQALRKQSGARKVGVLSTLGTHRMGIYTKELMKMGFQVESPSQEEFDTFISPAIAMAKANRCSEAEQFYQVVADRLFQRGAEIIILGCTEIPLSMERPLREQPSRFVDSTDALVESTVAWFFPEQRNA